MNTPAVMSAVAILTLLAVRGGSFARMWRAGPDIWFGRADFFTASGMHVRARWLAAPAGGGQGQETGGASRRREMGEDGADLRNPSW